MASTSTSSRRLSSVCLLAYFWRISRLTSRYCWLANNRAHSDTSAREMSVLSRSLLRMAWACDRSFWDRAIAAEAKPRICGFMPLV